MPIPDSETLRAQLQKLFGTELVIEGELGRGGMAVVYGAMDPSLERRVAVKMLLPQYAYEEDVARRFLREGRTMASLEHPHVVSVYGVRGDAWSSAIVMQFVEGRTLEAALARAGLIPLDLGMRLLAQIASALQHAHEMGVVHRDVKPANVLIDRRVNALVSDFGIARRDDGTSTTMTGMVLGTSHYMSPEQRAGERVMPAADQYALGVMAFEVLTGRAPFVGRIDEVIRGHMTEPPPSLRGIRPEIPERVEQLVLRMLAKDPELRWPSLVQATMVLGEFAPGVDVSMRLTPSVSVTPVEARGPTSAPGSTAQWQAMAPPSGRSSASSPWATTRNAVIAAVVLVVATALLTWLVVS